MSCFAVAGPLDAEIIIRGTRWDVLGAKYGLATVGTMRSLGCNVLPTVLYDDAVELPLPDRHMDVIVSPYPPGVAEYQTLTRSQRAELRAQTQDRFHTVLRAFDPRREIEQA